MRNFLIPLCAPQITSDDVEAISNAAINLNYENGLKFIHNFEFNIKNYCHIEYAVATSSGTAALHLGLICLGVKKGDKVLVPSLTFAATAFAVTYVGAIPVFIDCDSKSWTLNCDLVEEYLDTCNEEDLPKVIVSVDIFGRTCDYEKLSIIAKKYGMKILIDAAEALGTQFNSSSHYSFADISILSFNTNKIVTSNGGGVLLTNNYEYMEVARKLLNQSRENSHWYEHNRIGYNYRLSPLLAALGNSQLGRIDEILIKKSELNSFYNENLSNIEGVEIVCDSKWEVSNKWITNIRFNADLYPGIRNLIYDHLKELGIETRFAWKPMHMQPVFKHSPTYLNNKSEEIYNESLCFPSGLDLKKNDIEYISEKIKKVIYNS
jgi:UDP-N-acetylbacillosamine transaminase